MNKMKNNDVLIWILVAIIVILVFSGLGMPFYGGMMGWMMGYGYGYPLFGWLFMILILAALVLFIIWLIKQLQGRK